MKIQKTNGHVVNGNKKRAEPLSIIITEEVFRSLGNGKRVCLATGETISEEQFQERGKGTWLKITPTA